VDARRLVHRLELVLAARLVVALVIEASAVVAPGDAGELGPANLVREVLAAVDVAHLDRAPVGAAVGQRIGEALPIVAGRGLGQRHRSVGGERVGVEQEPGRCAEALLHVDRRLILQAVVTRVEVVAAVLLGYAVALVVPQLRQARLDAVARRVREELLGKGVLLVDPGLELWAVEVLHPAVRGRRPGCRVVVGGVAAGRGRVREALGRVLGGLARVALALARGLAGAGGEGRGKQEYGRARFHHRFLWRRRAASGRPSKRRIVAVPALPDGVPEGTAGDRSAGSVDETSRRRSCRGPGPRSSRTCPCRPCGTA
jgi:hypothetical protein